MAKTVPLTDAEIAVLKNWLAADGRQLFTRIVECRIHKIEEEATERVYQSNAGEFSAPTKDAMESFRAAVRLRDCLKTLADVVNEPLEFASLV